MLGPWNPYNQPDEPTPPGPPGPPKPPAPPKRQASILSARVMGPEQMPEGYSTVENPRVSYAPQAGGLTSPQERTLGGRIQVLHANERLFQSWSALQGEEARPAPPEAPEIDQDTLEPWAPRPQPRPRESDPDTPEPGAGMPPPLPPRRLYDVPVLVQGENVEVRHQDASHPRLTVGEGGRLQGDPSVVQAYTAAQDTHDMFRQGLGREFRYPGDGRLSIHLGDPRATMIGPHYNPGTGRISTLNPSDAGDPDTIAHETGHAVLDAHRPDYDYRDSRTASTHEAFSDGTAMLLSLQDPQVRADVLARRARGERSNLATILAESNRGLPPPLPGQPPEGPSTSLEGRGIRDASQAPPSAPEEPGEQQHASSRRFSHGLYNSIEEVEARLRRENPGLSPEEALRQASDRVRSDFVRSLEFMPEGNRATQADLVRSMIRANQVDGRGELAEIYRRNFEAANLPTGNSGREALEARMQAAMASPGTRASEELLQAVPGVRGPMGPQVGALPAADDWLARNAETLGVQGQGLQSRQVYRNDRQETWVVFSDQPAGEYGHPRNLLRVGFDRTGRMIHADPRTWEERPSPPQGSKD